MAEKLAELKQKGGSGSIGSGTLQDYCYHLVFDNSHTDFSSSDIHSSRITINEGAYAVVDGKCYFYLDFTTAINMGANDTWVILRNLPSDTQIPHSVCTTQKVLNTILDGSDKRFQINTKSGAISSGTNIIAYGTLY